MNYSPIPRSPLICQDEDFLDVSKDLPTEKNKEIRERDDLDGATLLNESTRNPINQRLVFEAPQDLSLNLEGGVYPCGQGNNVFSPNPNLDNS